jgi:hypothetical protein
MAAIDFALPGDLELTATATSRSSPTVQDTASARVSIDPIIGLETEFDPGMVELPQPGATTFLLMVENTGNTEDVYTARITATSGPVAASLVGLDGQPAQTIPVFRLPGLATGAILLSANLLAFGHGDITVEISSQAHAGVVASATATVMSELEVDPCDAAPVVRAGVGAGNVRAEMVNGRLTITGDKLLNNIRIAAGLDANSLCIIGDDGTTVNGRSVPELIAGVTGSVFIRMSGASDSVLFDGSLRPITLHGDLTIRMNSTRDTLRLDHVTVAGKTRVRTGRGRDLVELVDTVLTGKSSIFTGRGDDTLRVHTSQFLSDILFDGYLGTDILDAGTSRRPNSNGNLFARLPRVEFETLLS